VHIEATEAIGSALPLFGMKSGRSASPIFGFNGVVANGSRHENRSWHTAIFDRHIGEHGLAGGTGDKLRL
jgi:hypothetical protein